MVPLKLLCLLLLFGHGMAYLFKIRASLSELDLSRDESLEIECFFSPDESVTDSGRYSVEETHIVRKDSSGKWTELARLQSNGHVEKSITDLQIYGNIGPGLNDTFLKLYREHASKDDIGTYRCDVVLKDESFSLYVEESNLLTVSKHNLTLEEVSENSQRQIDNLQSDFDKFKQNAQKKLARLEKSVKQLKNESQNQDDKSQDDVTKEDLDELKDDITRSILVSVSAQVDALSCSRLAQCDTTKDTDTAQEKNIHLVDDDLNAGGQKDVSKSNGRDDVSKPDSQKDVSKPDRQNDVSKHDGQKDISKSDSQKGVSKSDRQKDVPKPDSLQDGSKPDGQKDGSKADDSLDDSKSDDQAASSGVEDTERQWPAGRFGLPKPNSGCPSTNLNPNWSEGHIHYHTESVDENHDSVTYGHHLAEPVLEVSQSGKHFVNTHFCFSDNINPVDEPWPVGAYCIIRGASKCPGNFHSGSVFIDEEDEEFSGTNGGVLQGQETIFFCCRNDGSPSTPITLPSSRPFYLYRFGGKCQQVKDMQVTPERILFDTENDNNEDEYDNDFHPDGKLEDVEIELCYYS